MARVSNGKAGGLLRLIALLFTRWLTVVSSSYTSVVKHGKEVMDLLIHQEDLLECLVLLMVSSMMSKWQQNLRVLTAWVSMIYNFWESRFCGRKPAWKAVQGDKDEHIDSLRRKNSFTWLPWSTSTNLLHHPIPRGGNSGKILILACLEFSSPPSQGFPEPSQKSRIGALPHHEKSTTHHAKLKFCR